MGGSNPNIKLLLKSDDLVLKPKDLTILSVVQRLKPNLLTFPHDLNLLVKGPDLVFLLRDLLTAALLLRPQQHCEVVEFSLQAAIIHFLVASLHVPCLHLTAELVEVLVSLL
jgi:hypothetical protein